MDPRKINLIQFRRAIDTSLPTRDILFDLVKKEYQITTSYFKQAVKLLDRLTKLEKKYPSDGEHNGRGVVACQLMAVYKYLKKKIDNPDEPALLTAMFRLETTYAEFFNLLRSLKIMD